MSSCFGQTSQWHIPVRVHDAAVLLSSRRNPFSKLPNMLIQHGILFACFPVVNVLQHECSFLTIKNPKSKKVCRRISSSFLLSQVSWSVGSKFCIRKNVVYDLPIWEVQISKLQAWSVGIHAWICLSVSSSVEVPCEKAEIKELAQPEFHS